MSGSVAEQGSVWKRSYFIYCKNENTVMFDADGSIIF